MAVAQKSDLPFGPIAMHSPKYFSMCAIGGILSCGLTHFALTPLDYVKCNAQANPKDFPGTIGGFKKIYNGELADKGYKGGFTGIFKGWGPTLLGYSVQGLFKFGLYEVFEHVYGSALGEEKAFQYRTLLHIASSASAEFFADIGLCPFEAVKVRIQTSPTFARGLMDGLPKFIAQEGAGNLFAGLTPLWARQIPYTVIKFVAFEAIAEKVYSMMPKPKSEMSKVEQMGVVFLCGYMAGILCGAVSHPADTMVSKINKLKMSGSLGQKMSLIYSGDAAKGIQGIGFSGLWAGFWPRVVMIGTLTGLQWFIYGTWKAYVGLPLPGKDVKKT
eukprot:TRINITY_DN1957_c0_g4_i1.p1 TRINITY_DN1957_c0_g4~~TRINITY_DN1957_c0_g4_i1.p1  ORF type:complete len:330 (-),score=85.13 TRINITY_DN1957_c0_g4_i1:151-1140(-)